MRSLASSLLRTGVFPWLTLYLGPRTLITHDAYNNPTTIQYADGSMTTMLWGYGGSPFDATGVKRREEVIR
jgi:hypothetical protein